MKNALRATSALISLLGAAFWVLAWFVCGVPQDLVNWTYCVFVNGLSLLWVAGGVVLYRLAEPGA